jgi:hypothetical protein
VTSDFLSEKRAEIDSRLKELRPLHEEFLKLERAKAALDGLDSSSPRRGPGRPRGSTSSASAAPARSGSGGNGRRRRRNRRSGGTRAEQALEAVRQNPGITVSELAPKIGITQKNYLYRVMNGLQSEGAVEKQGRGFVAV